MKFVVMLSWAIEVPAELLTSIQTTVTNYVQSLSNFAPLILGFVVTVAAVLGFWAYATGKLSGVFRRRR